MYGSHVVISQSAFEVHVVTVRNVPNFGDSCVCSFRFNDGI